MKKIALALCLAIASPAYAEIGMVSSHVGGAIFATLNMSKLITVMTMQASTTTWANNTRTAIITSDSGTETMVTATTVGLDLTNIGGVSVILKTSAAATAGGTLQAYLLNPETGTWARATDLDLTAVASANQTWPALWVPVSRGRLYYNPSGIGSVTTTIYLVGQPK